MIKILQSIGMSIEARIVFCILAFLFAVSGAIVAWDEHSDPTITLTFLPGQATNSDIFLMTVLTGVAPEPGVPYKISGTRSSLAAAGFIVPTKAR